MRDLWALPLSWLFGALVGLKNFLYDRGLKKIDRLEAPVIAVGNLSMGGTGKSPVTADLVARLSALGLRTAVLSRGYGRRKPERVLRVDPAGDWRDFGDEPAMIARIHPNVAVCVGPSRYAAAEAAADTAPQVYLVDDGFQHRQLHRDLDLVLIDVTQGRPRLFPRALFREGMASLRRADAVLLTRWDGEQTLSDWVTAVRRVKPDLPVLKLRYDNPRLLDLWGAPLDPADYKEKRVAAYAGIARPQQFFDTLAGMGLPPLHTLALRDHEAYEGPRAESFERRCAQDGVSLIVTTAKDVVKLEKQADSAMIKAFLTIDILWEDPDQIDEILLRITGK
ncbi:MAG: tetraacyldisaccharide 4'-kinase [Acidobacteriota bacterium]|nr:tetraacyldisaccharide 4'-kinase [Acidobacteriota bacterium]